MNITLEWNIVRVLNLGVKRKVKKMRFTSCGV